MPFILFRTPAPASIISALVEKLRYAVYRTIIRSLRLASPLSRSLSRRFPAAILLLALALMLAPQPPAHAQRSAPCGVVDGLDYPIDISDTLEQGFDDFGRYRERFGGLHVGLDIGFRRLGEPVYAAARGLVTYSDTEGWDTEKGVVIVEHTFPDGSIIYTLYGHMEETDTLRFPAVGACVERGQVLGGIGWPSRGLPHLHYEIRNFMPDDGGPGYVLTNPLLQGWYHPLEFTQLWRARLAHGLIFAVTFDTVPQLPPVLLDSGTLAAAVEGAVQVVFPNGGTRWRTTTSSSVTGIAALPDDRVVIHTEDGTAMTLQGGRFMARWETPGSDVPFVTLGEMLIFLTDGGGLAAYDASGTRLWSLSGISGDAESAVFFAGNGHTVAVGARSVNGYRLRVIDQTGTPIYQSSQTLPPVAAPGLNGKWLLLDGASLAALDGSTRTAIGSLGQIYGRDARLTVDIVGNSYIYLDDRDSTLLSLGPNGEPRWRVPYPTNGNTLAPLLDTGNGCMLYALDANGTLNVFNTEDGSLLQQIPFYAGGSRNRNPDARLLDVDRAEQVLVGTGFLSVAALDGMRLGGQRAATCLLG